MTDKLEDFGKVPPQAIDLEEAILGALIVEREAIDEVYNDLSADVFYKTGHQKIWVAIKELYEDFEPIDILTVTEKLRKKDELDLVGGPFYITQLSTKITPAAILNIKFHSKILLQKYIQREIIRFSHEVGSIAYDDSADLKDVLDYTNSKLDKINQLSVRGAQALEFRQLLNQSMEDYAKREQMAKKGEVIGVPTPIMDLTKIMNGWQNGDLIVMAGRPSMGKTAMLLACAKTAAEAGFNPSIFSLEMSAVRLTDRLICADANIKADKFRDGFLDISEHQELEKSIGRLERLGITIDDDVTSSINSIKAKARILKKKGKCSIIFIDYLQLMGGDNNGRSNKNREQEVSEISRQCKLMAKELDVPVVLLAQLNRNVELRGGDKRPQMSDLRESGAIEQDADSILFLYRPAYYGITEDFEGNSLIGVGEVIIGKNRNGKVGTVLFRHNDSLTKIYDFTDEPVPENYHPKQTNIDEFIEPNRDFDSEDDMPF